MLSVSLSVIVKPQDKPNPNHKHDSWIKPHKNTNDYFGLVHLIHIFLEVLKFVKLSFTNSSEQNSIWIHQYSWTFSKTKYLLFEQFFHFMRACHLFVSTSVFNSSFSFQNAIVLLCVTRHSSLTLVPQRNGSLPWTKLCFWRRRMKTPNMKRQCKVSNLKFQQILLRWNLQQFLDIP